jgi:hypothetical protein
MSRPVMARPTSLKTRARTVALGLAVAAIAVTALAGTAGAAGKSSTKVLIQAESGGFFGYVKSPNVQKCANGRTVVLYEQLGSKQSPSSDTPVGKDTAQANNDGYQWNIGGGELTEGRYYARALPTPQCKPANSVTLKAQE